MNDSIKSHLEEWTNLFYPKKENVYKRKLLVEKAKKHHRITFPFIRAVAASLVSDSLISVQPLEAPTGILFYMDYNNNSNKRMLLIERRKRRRRRRRNEGRKIYR
jgi:hypothetical protein